MSKKDAMAKYGVTSGAYDDIIRRAPLVVKEMFGVDATTAAWTVSEPAKSMAAPDSTTRKDLIMLRIAPKTRGG